MTKSLVRRKSTFKTARYVFVTLDLKGMKSIAGVFEYFSSGYHVVGKILRSWAMSREEQ